MGVVLAQKGQMPEAAEAFRNSHRPAPGFRRRAFWIRDWPAGSGDPAAKEEFRTAKMLDDLAQQPDDKNAKPQP